MAAGDLWLAGNTPNDVYRSSDDGATWTSGINGPAGQTSIQGIAVAPNGDLWLAGNIPDDVYRSSDDGATWTSVGITGPSGQTSIRGIAVAPNGDLWLAGTTPDDVYRSSDDGATWTSDGITGPAGQSSITGIAVAPNGDLWLAGTTPDDVYRSSDDGATWTSVGITGPSGQTFISGIAVAPNGDLWLAGGVPDDVYRSSDDGATWTSVGITGPAGQTSISGIAFDPRTVPPRAAGDLWLTGATPNDVYRSSDDGATWTSVGITGPVGQTNIQDIAVAPNGDLWLAGNSPDDVYRSSDDGATWTSDGITGPAGQATITGIAVAPNRDLWLAGTTPDDVYRSSDDGATWTSVGITGPAGQTSIQSIAVAPNGDLWLAGATPDDVYRSSDDGATWTSVGITGPAGQTNITGIAVAPNRDLWLTGTTPDDVYRSSDDGATWTSVGITGPAGQTGITGIAFDPRTVPAFADDTGDDIDGTVGTAIADVTVARATGVPTPTYSSEGDEPAGVTINLPTADADGSLEFDEDAIVVGSGTITIRATNSAGTDDWTVDYDFAAALPDADAPTVSINAVGDGDENTTVQLGATLSGGTYDAIDYAWAVSGGSLDDAASATPTWTRPSVTTDNEYDIELAITARGTGADALDGTSDTATAAARMSTVENVPVTTTDTDSVWRLATADPGAPAGGTGTETHTPAGWTRTEPEATETEGVWRSQRTRSFSDAAFTSATAWGAPTETEARLLALSDFVVPEGRVEVFAALIEVGVSGVERYQPSSDVGSLLDGDLELADDITINRIRANFSATSINRSGAGSFETYLEGTGAYTDGRLHAQNASGVTAVDVADIADADIGGGWINVRNAAFRGRLSTLAAGGRYILALTTIFAAIEVEASASLGPIGASASATVVDAAVPVEAAAALGGIGAAASASTVTADVAVEASASLGGIGAEASATVVDETVAVEAAAALGGIGASASATVVTQAGPAAQSVVLGAGGLASGTGILWEWDDATAPVLDAGLVEGPAVIKLRYLFLGAFGAATVIRLAESGQGEATQGGDDFTEQMEAHGTITFSFGSNEVVLSGISDATEPYSWTPAQSTDAFVTAYYTNPPASTTIRFNNGLAGSVAVEASASLGGIGASASATVVDAAVPVEAAAALGGIEAAASAIATEDPVAVEAAAALGGIGAAASASTVTADVAVEASASLGGIGASAFATAVHLLELDDSDDTGQIVIAKALLVASGPGTAGSTFYADPDRGGTGAPLDGELGLGAGETAISRLRRVNAGLLLLNDNNNPVALALGPYFADGGGASEATIYLQTRDAGEVSFAVSTQRSGSLTGGGFINFSLPDDARALLDGLATGDLFIFKLAQIVTPVVVQAAAALGGIGATASAIVIDETVAVEASAALGPIGASASATVVDAAVAVEAAASLGGIGASASAIATEDPVAVEAGASLGGIGASASAIATEDPVAVEAAASLGGIEAAASAIATEDPVAVEAAAALGGIGASASAIVRDAVPIAVQAGAAIGALSFSAIAVPRDLLGPSFRAVPDFVIYAGIPVDIQLPRVHGETADGVYSISGLPDGLVFDPGRQRITGTTEEDPAEFSITVSYA